jgi:hypothetical protein
MARKKKLIDPVRQRILDLIEIEVDASRECVQRASDLAELLNALDDSNEKIEIDGNVVVGAFKKEAKKDV